jgi:hypothetical protein
VVVALPVLSVLVVTGLRVPQAALGNPLRVKRTGSLWVIAVVQVPGVQVTMAVTVTVVEPSAGVHAVAGGRGTQNGAVVLVTTVPIPEGCGFSV